MYEQYHPLGIVGIISAFNFPVAVWSWNTALAWICGDVCVWKPSEKTPLCSVACQKIIADILKENDLPEGISCLINGDYKVGEYMTKDKRIPLISATGSTRMGKIVASEVGARLGKSLLELGGNNAIIVDKSADLDLTLRGVLFGAVGTTGQRCTTTRRLFLHEDIADSFTDKLVAAYGQVRIGDAMDSNTLMGPLIDQDAVDMYLEAIDAIRAEGGEILCGGRAVERSGFYVEPTVVRATPDMKICQHETFAPVLYVFRYSDLEQAIRWQNDVPQGLSSAIFTDSFRQVETFLSHDGSDCGIANVNIGTSGAEIGGAFGGEKETGGGREAGSDSWKAYMRRQTCTLNWSPDLPLAQGVSFDL